MQIVTSYSVKIKKYNHIFKETISVYRKAVDFFIEVAFGEWNVLKEIDSIHYRQSHMEKICIRTAAHPEPEYPFETQEKCFYKFPSYLRRSAINEAVGKVSSYISNLERWEDTAPAQKGRKPSFPKAGHIFPVFYHKNMYQRTGDNTAKIKIYIRNTWDWLEVSLRKGDADYIKRHCIDRKECSPTLQKRGKEWFLDFAFKETIVLKKQSINTSPDVPFRILAVDLGLNNACACCVMDRDGTIHERKILSLTRETDQLTHSINRIKKAQQHGNTRTPRLWARAKGLNHDIAVKTTAFISGMAIAHDVDVVIFEHLDLGGKKRGSKKQRLHLWKAKAVQSMVELRVHRHGIRISRVNAWNTSRLAYDGSGRVSRGSYLHNGVEKYNYSICVFTTGKTYHADLNASYNIGARYLIREIIKSLPETVGLEVLAKVPEASKRSTCTLSTLFNLNAVLAA